MQGNFEHPGDETMSPLTETERVVATLWREVLRTSGPLCPTDNFFELGGDSVGMVTVIFRINEEFSVELPEATILDAPSLRDLATVVDSSAGTVRTSGDL
jgi:acyl carrier protein